MILCELASCLVATKIVFSAGSNRFKGSNRMTVMVGGIAVVP